MKVLIVDDDPDVQEMLKDYFLTKNYEMLTAGSASEALHLAFHERPDCMVLDLGLPDFSGEEVLLRVKKYLPKIRVVILTGRSDAGLFLRLRDLGCDSCFEKGVPLSTVEAALLG